MTKKTAEKIADWYLKHINPTELDKKIEATLEYVKRFNEPEDGEWNLWAYEIVSGQHGVHTIGIFLSEVLDDKHWEDETDPDAIMETYDEISQMLSRFFNDHSKLGGTFWLGHHPSDGSLGVTYSEKA